jgi:type I restriction enzyme, S subunit
MGKGFQMVSLGELLTPVNRPEPTLLEKQYSILGAHWYAHGLYIKDVKLGSEIQADRVYRIEEGDFVYNRLFAWKGSFALALNANHGCYVSNEFPCFRVMENKIDGQYLWKYFSRSSAWNEALGLSSGGTPTSRNRLKEEKLLEMKIPLPPLEEQRRIVARIEELAARIEEARGLRREAEKGLEVLVASLSDAVFKPQSGWTEYYIRDFCEPPQYGYTESATNEPVGPRFLRITDIQNGRVHWNNVPFCRCPNPEQYLLKENDLVFARTGATTGKSFLIRDCPEAIFASYLIRLRVRRLVTADYLYHYFQTPSYWVQITDVKKGTGQPNVNGTKLANIRVPIPPPEEQKCIVAYLEDLQEKIDSLKQLQSETSAELDALLPSILDKAFKGEL